MEVPKKKRGRKPKKKENKEPVVKIKKKRGRKQKIKDKNAVKEVKIPKKRGRKPKINVVDNNLNIYGSNGSKNVNNIVNDNYENIILHLPIKSSEIIQSDFTENILLNYKPSLKDPEPYEPDEMLDYAKIDFNNKKEVNNKENNVNKKFDIIVEDDFTVITDKKNKNDDTNTEIKYKERQLVNKNIRNIQYEFIDGNNRNEWPLSVNIACNWCCHKFKGPPCAIPSKIIKGVYHVYGCFCSFNCAAAHIFDKKDINMWEHYSLLILLYKSIYNKSIYKIPIAPPRETLKIFGGFYSIEEYRENLYTNNKIYKIVQPPMISLVPKIEENKLDYDFKNNNKHYIPLDGKMLDTAEESLRLKRSKPITNVKNTLQSYMNLKIV